MIHADDEGSPVQVVMLLSYLLAVEDVHTDH
jgi:hypothetical protein